VAGGIVVLELAVDLAVDCLAERNLIMFWPLSFLARLMLLLLLALLMVVLLLEFVVELLA